MWDAESQLFMVGDQELTLEVEDIYFITGLSHRGATTMFTERGGGGESINTYVREYCNRGTQKVIEKLPISQVVSLSLRTILFTMTHIVGSMAPHLATKGHIQYDLIALDGMVYN